MLTFGPQLLINLKLMVATGIWCCCQHSERVLEDGLCRTSQNYQISCAHTHVIGKEKETKGPDTLYSKQEGHPTTVDHTAPPHYCRFITVAASNPFFGNKN